MADDKKKQPFYLIDTGSAFYKPLGRRVIICAATVVWAGLESWHKDPFWSVISIACAAYCIYVLLWAYKPPVDPQPRPPDVDDDAAGEPGAAETVVSDAVAGGGEDKSKP
jgi:hypothetical protein